MRTPLFDFNVRHGGRMVDFAGWEMPVQYDSIVGEHKMTRESAGLFDVSHMGEATVEGPEALAFLNFVLTNDVSQMDDGKALYSLMCYEHGGVVDDLLVYRRSETSYLLCLNASNVEKDLDWLAEKTSGFDVKVTDVCGDYGLLALQGPKALGILADLTDVDLSELSYYRFADGKVAGVDCIVCRTGYTGEPGVEIFTPWGETEAIAEALLAAGASLAGLGARDSLRLEAGYSLYGHEIGESISPVQAGLMWTVKLGKECDFVGKAAISEEKAAGPAKRIVFFKTGGRRIARPGATVVSSGEVVGEVVSGTFSPVLNEAIGSVLIDAKAAKGATLAVDVRGKEMAIEPAKPPFVELNPQA